MRQNPESRGLATPESEDGRVWIDKTLERLRTTIEIPPELRRRAHELLSLMVLVQTVDLAACVHPVHTEHPVVEQGAGPSQFKAGVEKLVARGDAIKWEAFSADSTLVSDEYADEVVKEIAATLIDGEHSYPKLARPDELVSNALTYTEGNTQLLPVFNVTSKRVAEGIQIEIHSNLDNELVASEVLPADRYDYWNKLRTNVLKDESFSDFRQDNTKGTILTKSRKQFQIEIDTLISNLKEQVGKVFHEKYDEAERWTNSLALVHGERHFTKNEQVRLTKEQMELTTLFQVRITTNAEEQLSDTDYPAYTLNAVYDQTEGLQPRLDDEITMIQLDLNRVVQWQPDNLPTAIPGRYTDQYGNYIYVNSSEVYNGRHFIYISVTLPQYERGGTYPVSIDLTAAGYGIYHNIVEHTVQDRAVPLDVNHDGRVDYTTFIYRDEILQQKLELEPLIEAAGLGVARAEQLFGLPIRTNVQTIEIPAAASIQSTGASEGFITVGSEMFDSKALLQSRYALTLNPTTHADLVSNVALHEATHNIDKDFMLADSSIFVEAFEGVSKTTLQLLSESEWFTVSGYAPAFGGHANDNPAELMASLVVVLQDPNPELVIQKQGEQFAKDLIKILDAFDNVITTDANLKVAQGTITPPILADIKRFRDIARARVSE